MTPPSANPSRGEADGCIALAAPAKVNLDLRVGPSGADGFHPLNSLVSRITLCDRLELAVRTDGQVGLSCEGHDCGPAEQNLAVRAARLMREVHGSPDCGVDIRLTKRIPTGMGLGGGSSDAAAVLRGLRRLWNLQLTDAQMIALAADLGSDVPMFLGPASARITGRGQHVEPVVLPEFCLVLHMPDIHCGTRDVYAAFDERPEPMADPLDPAELGAIPPSRWHEKLVNQLAGPAQRAYPRLAKAWRDLEAAAGRRACLTGSGAGLMLLCDGPDQADALHAALPEPIRRQSMPVGVCPS